MVQLSVIVPVYNTGNYLRSCLDSLTGQTKREIEIICVDDGSTDGSSQILDDYADKDARIQVIHKQNEGVVAARAEGLARAAGEYVSFVDSDDWLEPDMLERLFDSRGAADLVSCGVFRELSPGHVIRRRDKFEAGIYQGRTRLNEILGSMIYDFQTCELQPLTPWIYNKLYRRKLAREVMTSADKSISYGEDSVFLYQYLLKCSEVILIRDCYYHYRYREDSAIHSENQTILMDINRVFLSLIGCFQNHEMRAVLLPQLQRWIALLTCFALNQHMGFDPSIVSIPEFVMDTGTIGNKNLILYGAGQAGQDAYRQLQQFGYPVVSWVDRDFARYQRDGLDIQDPKDIGSMEYDVIVLAVKEERVAKAIRKDLILAGIPEEKVVWKQPWCVF